ncbi:DUF3426 domain-containing protein [Methylophilus aquaticus]|uniref:DUF3426 domain-containing protein n=1 Tax=Methylophilus aquaticus TaxID=1971610 RepID=A0ABT9JTI8_9PROT|nr:DUF3426 domain-containing protein [Methylophilus aquaticus]MDP8567898.1 DUF3426 domain-containing protein [Methylophilus aquaticus]
MSLITACPACQTQFEVTEAELHAYRGKVRCGECEHVFDAAAHLLNSEDAGTPQSPLIDVYSEVNPSVTTSKIPASISETASAEPNEIYTSPAHVLDTSESDGIFSPEPQQYDAFIPAADSADKQLTQPEHETLTDAIDARQEIVETQDAPLQEITLTQHPALHVDDLLASGAIAADTAIAEPSVPEFLRNVSLSDERPPQPAPSSTKQSAYFGLMVLCTLAVLIQLLYFSRAHLIAHYPQTKPLLQSFCRVLHCELSLPQDIAQFTIDDADIQEHRERDGVLVFSSVLMNHAQVAQAYPLIELTLTNTSDEPVLRRILKPQEYLPTALNKDEGLAAQQEIRINSLLGVPDQEVAGFRVAIAY